MGLRYRKRCQITDLANLSVDTSGNRLIGSLRHSDRALMAPHLNPVHLRFRQRLEQSQRSIKAAYFVESGIASVIAIGGKERRQAEVAVVGRDGMVGVPLLFGLDRSACETIIQLE